MKQYLRHFSFVNVGMMFCLLPIVLDAQSKIIKPKAKITFSSVYTKLDSQTCQADDTAEDAEHEPNYLCQGFKDYKIYLSFTCCQTMVYVGENIKLDTSEEQFLKIPMIYGSQSPNGETIEWRLANGKPFAVILRINQDSSLIDPTLKKGLETTLNILSLTGYKKINASINVRKFKNANEVIRKKADQGYKKL